MKSTEPRMAATDIPTRDTSMPLAVVKALRPTQWIKNFFVFAPAIFAKAIFDWQVVGRVAIGFAVFSAVSSATYLLNDVLDRENDRAHPVKRNRPIASGRISPGMALGLSAVLALTGLGVGALVDPIFAAVALTYLAFTLGYSLYVKHVVLLDVMFLAAGFVLRVAGGAVVARVEASEWLFLCMLLLALFLGFSKRRHEITLLESGASGHRRVLEHYSAELLDQMLVIVASSAILCYILYTVWPSTVEKFHTKHLIYTVPFVIYGIFRYFFLIHQRASGGDPTGTLLTDRPLLVSVLLWVAVAVGVIYFRV
jgi:4-hydroxybenzoate polyprenyltransferase